MEVSLRRRMFWLVGLTFGFYALALTLIGIAWGFDHGLSKWLIAAALVGLAAGMGASIGMRLVVLVGDSRVRSMWWDTASSARRALWLVAIALRIGGVIALLYVAVRNLAG